MQLGVKSGTSNVAIYAETGRTSLYIRCKLKCIKYVMRLLVCNLDNNTIVKTIFNILIELENPGFNNWVTKVRSTLEELNVLYLLELDNISAQESEKVLNKIKSEMFNSFEEESIRKLENFSVLNICKF